MSDEEHQPWPMDTNRAVIAVLGVLSALAIWVLFIWKVL